MKSIKPGRGPSKLSMIGSIGAVIFGVFWCIAAVSMGGWFMFPFGLVFIGIAGYSAYYNYHNATSEDRYSVCDIVDGEEEGDPLNEKYGRKKDVFEDRLSDSNGTSAEYCPFCGRQVSNDFDFCPKCGKKLPD